MNILLIYPEFPDTFWSFRHALKLARKKASSPPLGLLTVAAMLPSEWGKRLVDLNVTKLTAKDLAWADAALVSAMLVQRDAARQLIARCRKVGVRIIAGGPLFTDEYEQFGEVDHFVLDLTRSLSVLKRPTRPPSPNRASVKTRAETWLGM